MSTWINAAHSADAKASSPSDLLDRDAVLSCCLDSRWLILIRRLCNGHWKVPAHPDESVWLIVIMQQDPNDWAKHVECQWKWNSRVINKSRPFTGEWSLTIVSDHDHEKLMINVYGWRLACILMHEEKTAGKFSAIFDGYHDKYPDNDPAFRGSRLGSG